jgi:cytochrome c
MIKHPRSLLAPVGPGLVLLALVAVACAPVPTLPSVGQEPVPRSASAPVQAGTPVVAGDVLRRGEVFAKANCSTCHAVGRDGPSPNPLAPPFRKLGQRYPVENLSEALAEGIFTGHPVMPTFELAPHEVDDLIAWLTAIQEGPD